MTQDSENAIILEKDYRFQIQKIKGGFTMEAVIMPEKDKTEVVRVEYMETRYPAYMTYETKVGKKEKYNAILADFKEMHEKLFDQKTGLVYDLYQDGKDAVLEDGKFKSVSAGYYLMGVIDTMAATAQEIYEQYKTYEGIFKEAVKGVLHYYKEEEGIFRKYIETEKEADIQTEANPVDAEASLMIAYAIWKGCSMKALLFEKYMPIAERLFVCAKEALQEKETDEGKKQMDLAREQYLKCCEAMGEEAVL